MKRYILLLVIFLISCQTIPSETTKPSEVLFCNTDNCADKLLSLIESSKETVCALYALNNEEVVKTLNEKNALVILEKDNRNRVNNLLLNKRYDDSPYLMHNKFCIFDDAVWTGSWNPTKNLNHDNVLVLYSKYLAQNYKKEFNELWNDNDDETVLFPEIILNSKKIKNYFCPEDSCAEKVLRELDLAESSIYFMIFSFTDDRIGDMLLKKANQGLKIKGLIEKKQSNEWSEFEKLKEYITFYSGEGLLHHKVFIIDEKSVISGSYNPTKAGDEKNDENIIILEDQMVARKFIQEFKKLEGNII